LLTQQKHGVRFSAEKYFTVPNQSGKQPEKTEIKNEVATLIYKQQ
jgi:hypothetical protein